MSALPRVVLDTNVVLSALLFAGGRVAQVRQAWHAMRFVPLASTATAAELIRVLRYPKFALSADEQEDLLADFMPWVSVVRVPLPPPKVPLCRDASDVPFLQLAAAGRASALITGDKDLLAVGVATKSCPVLTVDAFCAKVLA